MNHRLLALLLAAVATACVLADCATTSTVVRAGGPIAEWPHYGNDAGGMRYSPLDQINRENVASLKVAWEYHTGDVSDGTHTKRKTAFENTPIVVDGTMYLSTPFNRVIALDPETGTEKWAYDPKIDLQGTYSEGLINRGVSSWLDATRAAGRGCGRRIFIATIDARLIALDAADGRPCADFGDRGQIALMQGVKNIDKIRYQGEFEETSPPAIIDDLVVVGSAIGDNGHVDEPSGVVRAFDARSGALRWSWYPIPETSGDPAWKTWSHSGAPNSGAANTWSIISVDPEHDLVFLPVSSASPDYYGGERPGNDVYSDSLVALHGSTGKLAWYFQTTHHDLWDYDNPSMPLLCTIRHNGVEVPAVVQGTKRGSLFVFNRLTGEPLFPIVEKPVPQTDVPGEETSPTQPFPAIPPLVPQTISADDAFGITYFDRSSYRKRMAALRNDGTFTPPSINGSLIIPGNVGGMNWSSAAFDPTHQLLVTNTNNVAAEVHLIPRADFDQAANASRGFDLEFAPQLGTPYGMSRIFMRSFVGLPCNPPPWGSLTAVDLSTGQIRWTSPLGQISGWLHLPPLPGSSGWGTPNLGGAIVTAGGLVFIGAAMDPAIRAFDIETGKMLWKATLPAGGQATPMTYRLRSDGKQYVVIAAGGHGKMGTKLGDSVVAFGLP